MASTSIDQQTASFVTILLSIPDQFMCVSLEAALTSRETLWIAASKAEMEEHYTQVTTGKLA